MNTRKAKQQIKRSKDGIRSSIKVLNVKIRKHIAMLNRIEKQIDKAYRGKEGTLREEQQLDSLFDYLCTADVDPIDLDEVFE